MKEKRTLNITIVSLLIMIALNLIILWKGLCNSFWYPFFVGIFGCIVIVCIWYVRWYKIKYLKRGIIKQ